MSKFRKRPVVIEAVQFFLDGVKVEGVTYPDKYYIGNPYIETLEGRMIVSDGDWVITGVNGERYPCKPDIFEKTYEAVELPTLAAVKIFDVAEEMAPNNE